MIALRTDPIDLRLRGIILTEQLAIDIGVRRIERRRWLVRTPRESMRLVDQEQIEALNALPNVEGVHDHRLVEAGRALEDLGDRLAQRALRDDETDLEIARVLFIGSSQLRV